LNALQADPSVPRHLVDLAAPIAQAMGALHQLERTNQIAPHADVAMNHLRGALAQLQTAGASHPAVTAALDAVAQSLSLVHALGRAAAPQPPPPPVPMTAPLMPPQQVAAAAQASTMRSPTGQIAGQMAGPPMTGPMGQMTAPMSPTGQMPQRQAPMGGPPPGPPPMVARDPFGAPPPAGPPATPSMPVPAPPPTGNMQPIAAELGAHSPTNFYKGLSGNDIIDHGGLFVSTYMPPKIGTPVRLKVSLPGGYEFEANAVVKWTREQGGDAPPGFGAQFTGITNEARQLVYRYVRNREPLFYDDF
jgi:uncharacterized protein (TIGR02266 family)